MWLNASILTFFVSASTPFVFAFELLALVVAVAVSVKDPRRKRPRERPHVGNRAPRESAVVAYVPRGV